MTVAAIAGRRGGISGAGSARPTHNPLRLTRVPRLLTVGAAPGVWTLALVVVSGALAARAAVLTGTVGQTLVLDGTARVLL